MVEYSETSGERDEINIGSTDELRNIRANDRQRERDTLFPETQQRMTWIFM